jgi:hypothetical protein
MISFGLSSPFRKFRNVTSKQYVFYGFIFLFGFVYQPNWVRDNFWVKAEFYGSLPFQFPYTLFLMTYSFLSVCASILVVRAIKRNL